MNIVRSFYGVAPLDVALLTWEWTTTYEKSPEEKELRNSFREDFPGTVEDLKDGFYLLWPLLSFNSPEGRRFRYLVALVGAPNIPEGRKRFLPRQIWLYGAADRMLRGVEKSSLDGFSNGNVLFYHCEHEILCVLIFYEGRLCHWIEESGYENESLVENRLKDLENFLKKDALFCRCNHYEFIRIEGRNDSQRSRFFRTASKDPFWGTLNLFPHSKNKLQKRRGLRKKILCCFLILVSLWILGNGEATEGMFPVDVVPPKLAVPNIIPSEEPRGALDRLPFRKPEIRCVVENLRVQGAIGGKLFLAGKKMFAVGDSIGNFVVKKIGGKGVEFFCGGKPYFVEVR